MNKIIKYPYIIMAPPYRNSSGRVRALYELRNHLELRGYEAKVFQGGDAPSNAIVVYPETVLGNPMKGRTVVRYVLNHPGLLGGDNYYDINEFIFTYSPVFYPTAPLLTVPIIEPFFRDYGLQREGGCFWVGKREDIVDEIPETKGLTEITYTWPETREELARLLNTKEIFYSYDDCTALIHEARKCGCKVVVISGEQVAPNYEDMIKDFDAQLDRFVRITQDAAEIKLKVSFGVMINDPLRFDQVFKRSQVEGKLNYIKNPESATKGLNFLLEMAEKDESDVCVLCHQDVYLRNGWVDQLREQIKMLPDSWVCAGIVGKDYQGRICGKFHDMRIPDYFDTSDIHSFPLPACCFDEAVIIINMKKGFRFDTSYEGFDLYGTQVVLKSIQMGGTAWCLGIYTEHFCLRDFGWVPDDLFIENYKRLYDMFEEVRKQVRLDSTAIGLPPGEELKFETSAGPEREIKEVAA